MCDASEDYSQPPEKYVIFGRISCTGPIRLLFTPMDREGAMSRLSARCWRHDHLNVFCRWKGNLVGEVVSRSLRDAYEQSAVRDRIDTVRFCLDGVFLCGQGFEGSHCSGRPRPWYAPMSWIERCLRANFLASNVRFCVSVFRCLQCFSSFLIFESHLLSKPTSLMSSLMAMWRCGETVGIFCMSFDLPMA